jgi:hypothetical protein
MNWLKWHVGTVTDPKFGIIARKVNQPRAVVIAVWAMLLETACNGEKRGDVTSFNPEEIGFALDVDAETVTAIFNAIMARGMVKDGGIAAWDKRQSYDYSGDRVRKHRAAKKDVTDVTPPTVTVTPGNAEEIEEIEEKDKKDSVPNGTGADAPPSPAQLEKQFWDSAKAFLKSREIPPQRVGALIGGWLKAIGPPDSHTQLLRLLASAEVNCKGDLVPYMEAAIKRLKDGNGTHTGKRRLTPEERRQQDLAGILKGMGTDIYGRERAGSGADREVGAFSLDGGEGPVGTG